jgi:hypothetical protein
MPTSNVEVTPGSGAKLATHSLTEDAATKHVSRVNVNDSAGADILGTKTDNKSTATDTTSVSAISLWKQISASIQAAAASLAGTLTVGSHPVTNAGTFAVQAASAGDVAHDAADSGNPVKVGHKAIAHGTNPTAVAAGDRTDSYANRAGIPFVIGGHPNVITRSATIDDADGAQTNASLLTVSAGSKIVVTSVSASCASSNSGAVAVRIGFATATLGAASESGTDGILLEGKFAAGGGHQRGNGAGILGIGADNEDLRITCDDPAGGSLFVTFSYYTIES